ncbi:unnamed protein product [Cylicocyclus nassatus]|uniref:Uncharacterized protein n=1 Tax=Cylicocyclus nassatus TaxID=53992 RepID=A0AA36HCA4_CYLNA|nr:unnamed protein product [Cylicocyclus nassatus]
MKYGELVVIACLANALMKMFRSLNAKQFIEIGGSLLSKKDHASASQIADAVAPIASYGGVKTNYWEMQRFLSAESSRFCAYLHYELQKTSLQGRLCDINDLCTCDR